MLRPVSGLLHGGEAGANRKSDIRDCKSTHGADKCRHLQRRIGEKLYPHESGIYITQPGSPMVLAYGESNCGWCGAAQETLVLSWISSRGRSRIWRPPLSLRPQRIFGINLSTLHPLSLRPPPPPSRCHPAPCSAPIPRLRRIHSSAS